MRVKITLRCDADDCGKSSYSTTKNKRTTTQRIQIRKYCKFCRKSVVFKETK
ncbi:50S ribosomal protein L33 [bacterium]|nr:50S ribosomal protein L33 [bacterium]